MSKDYKVYIEDILNSIKKIEKYTLNLNYLQFSKNELLVDGVTRNLEIIGEAVKQIPFQVRSQYPLYRMEKNRWFT